MTKFYTDIKSSLRTWALQQYYSQASIPRVYTPLQGCLESCQTHLLTWQMQTSSQNISYFKGNKDNTASQCTINWQEKKTLSRKRVKTCTGRTWRANPYPESGQVTYRISNGIVLAANILLLIWAKIYMKEETNFAKKFRGISNLHVSSPLRITNHKIHFSLFF